MEVHILSGNSSTLSQLPSVPIRSPIEIVNNLRLVYDQKQIETFQNMLDSLVSDGKFDLLDLDTIMIDAVRYDDAQFAEALFSHGLPLHPDYALEAAKWKAKNVLEALFKNGWNVNKPISDAQPPVLGFVARDQEMVSWLLRHGADPNQKCLIDLTPLSYAVHYAPISNIKLFLGNGGDTQ